MKILEIKIHPLSVPLKIPFVIATGRIESTRNVWVEVRAAGKSGEVVGMGEAAALPPVTHEDLPDFLRELPAAAERLTGCTLSSMAACEAAALEFLSASPAARAGLETALLDAWAKSEGGALHTLWPRPKSEVRTFQTDITLSIHAPEKMAEEARNFRARGFTCFKMKVGRSLQSDIEALEAIHRAVPDACFRIDANGGYDPHQALILLDEAQRLQAPIEVFEQPCAREDWGGMSLLVEKTDVPIIADESIRSLKDLQRICDEGCATGVNLKLAKMGGPAAAIAIGTRAKEAGLGVMVGGMVETRLGIAAMAHVAAALGGVDWVDLDTPLLLSEDPFAGGYRMDGPVLELLEGNGLGLDLR